MLGATHIPRAWKKKPVPDSCTQKRLLFFFSIQEKRNITGSSSQDWTKSRSPMASLSPPRG